MKARENTASLTMELQFGGKAYTIRKANLRQSRAWRAQRALLLERVLEMTSRATNGHDQNLFDGLRAVYLDLPDAILQLVTAYAPAVPRDAILAGTDAELDRAFTKIMRASYPLLYPGPKVN